MKQVGLTRRSVHAEQPNVSRQLFFLLAISVAIIPLLIGCVAAPMASNTPSLVDTPRLQVTPSSISFSSATVGVLTSQTLKLANTGEDALTVTSVMASGSGLSISGFSGSTLLNPGTSSTITVQFTPKTSGAFSGTLSVLTSTAAVTATLPITGEVAAANSVVAVGPSSLSFGTVSAGKPVTQNVTVSNTGNTAVTVSGVKVSGTGFSVTGWSSAVQLAISQAITLGVVFDPSASGNYTGSLTVASNASNSSVGVPLSGAAAQPSSAPEVALAWNASASAVSGYNVYRSTASAGPFTKLNGSLVAGLEYTDNSVAAGSTYYYVTTAVDSAGVESGYSNTAEAVVP